MAFLQSYSVILPVISKARTLPTAMGFIFQLDTKKWRAETGNFRERLREICTKTNYLGKHRIQ
jgi:hypothetical protein